MTIAELKELLKDYPDSMKIVVNGYENGYNNPRIDNVKIKSSKRDDDAYWEGEYEESRNGEFVLVIGR